MNTANWNGYKRSRSTAIKHSGHSPRWNIHRSQLHKLKLELFFLINHGDGEEFPQHGKFGILQSFICVTYYFCALFITLLPHWRMALIKTTSINKHLPLFSSQDDASPAPLTDLCLTYVSQNLECFCAKRPDGSLCFREAVLFPQELADQLLAKMATEGKPVPTNTFTRREDLLITAPTKPLLFFFFFLNIKSRPVYAFFICCCGSTLNFIVLSCTITIKTILFYTRTRFQKNGISATLICSAPFFSPVLPCFKTKITHFTWLSLSNHR